MLSEKRSGALPYAADPVSCFQPLGREKGNGEKEWSKTSPVEHIIIRDVKENYSRANTGAKAQ